MRGGVFNWPLRLGLIACCAVVPWCVTPWYTVALLMALPVLRAMLDAVHERPITWVCVASAYAAGGFLLPEWLWPAVALWGVGLMAMSIARVRAGSRTILAGLALAVATLVLALALALRRSGGPLVPWLAQAIVDGIDQHPKSASILLNAYQMGLARLEGRQAILPALQLGNAIIIPADTRLQMLYSLRTSIEALLTAYLPQGIVSWMLLTALLPALAAEGVLRLRGRHSDLPPLTRWYLSRELANGVLVMLLLGFLPYLTDAPALVSLGGMCYALGYWGCALQGASLAIFMMNGRGVKPLLCGLFIALIATALPLTLFFLGGFDQFRDPRHLRGPRDDMN